jgi:hypothetical protein
MRRLIAENEVGKGYVSSPDPDPFRRHTRPTWHTASVETPDGTVYLGNSLWEDDAEMWVTRYLRDPEYRARHGQVTR